MKTALPQRLKGAAGRYRGLAGLAERVRELEEEVQECRQVNLRLAELTDVMMELLVPLADRDPDRVEELLERYRLTISDPPPRR